MLAIKIHTILAMTLLGFAVFGTITSAAADAQLEPSLEP